MLTRGATHDSGVPRLAHTELAHRYFKGAEWRAETTFRCLLGAYLEFVWQRHVPSARRHCLGDCRYNAVSFMLSASAERRVPPTVHSMSRSAGTAHVFVCCWEVCRLIMSRLVCRNVLQHPVVCSAVIIC